MIITFKDPGWDYTTLWVTGSALAVLVLIALILTGYRASRRGSTQALDEWIFAIWMIALAWGLLGVLAIGGGLIGTEVYEDRYEAALVDALSDAGYESIEVGVESTEFTASTEDGKYFHAFLVPLEAPEGQVKYQIAEAAE